MGLDERVLCIPASELERLGPFQGYRDPATYHFEQLLCPEIASFHARRDVEDDPSWKQIITYSAFRCGGQVFSYTRGNRGELRLAGDRSLGVGGHVAEQDVIGKISGWTVHLAHMREVEEEVDLVNVGIPRLVASGLINDDSNPVGRVHLGLFYLYDVARPSIRSLEDALRDEAFSPVDGLAARRDEFETWSRIVIDSGILSA